MKEMTWGGEHTVQYTDDVLQNYTPETYIILLTSATPINSIKNNRSINQSIYLPLLGSKLSACFKKILILEGGGWRRREKARNTDVREKHRSVTSHMCSNQGLNPKPKLVP